VSPVTEDNNDLDFLGPMPSNVIKLPDRKARPAFKPWTIDEIENMPELSYLVGDEERPVLAEGALWQTYGKLKSAKTFWTLGLAFCVAFGIPFQGLPTKQGQVVYVLAEGGIKRNFRRVRALWDEHKEALQAKGFKTLAEAMDSNQLLLIDQAIGLALPTGPTAPQAFLEEMKRCGVERPSIIVLDTWARALWEAGGHDSDQNTVGPSVQACEAIRKTLGGCALIMVAHVGASNDKRAKGLTDPAGAIDGGTLCEKKGEGRNAVYSFTAVTQRHAVEGWKMSCTLAKPSEGSASVVLRAAVSTVTREEAQKLSGLTAAQKVWYKALRDLMTPDGVDKGDWLKAARAAGAVKADTSEDGARRARGEALKALAAGDLIEEVMGRLYLTGAAGAEFSDDDAGPEREE
jgi:hypothetical protein